MGPASVVSGAGERASFFVKTTVLGPVGERSTVLGVSVPPDINELVLPSPTLEHKDGKTFFVKVAAQDSDDFKSVSVQPITREWPGTPVYLTADSVIVPKDAPAEIQGKTIRLPGTIPDESKNRLAEDYTVRYVISEATANAIRDAEQEHPNDFAHAFTIAAAELANQVNALSGVEFEDETSAWTALFARLHPKLVPAHPSYPEAWQQRWPKIFAALYDLSKVRDRKAEHTPTGYPGTIDLTRRVIAFEPAMMAAGSRSTASLISFDNLKMSAETLDTEEPRLARQEMPESWAPGTTHTVREHTNASFFNEKLQEFDSELPKGAVAQVIGTVIHRSEPLLKVRVDCEVPAEGYHFLLLSEESRGKFTDGGTRRVDEVAAQQPAVTGPVETFALNDEVYIRKPASKDKSLHLFSELALENAMDDGTLFYWSKKDYTFKVALVGIISGRFVMKCVDPQFPDEPLYCEVDGADFTKTSS